VNVAIIVPHIGVLVKWGSNNMSEAWHQHLAHLSWWEEIDRFFFPSKYSCTTTWQPFDLVSILHIIVVAGIVVGIALGIWVYLASNTQQQTGDNK
jgi:hypothetical protein